MLIVVGGRGIEGMKSIKKRFPIIMIFVLITGMFAKVSYKYAVKEGYLGDAEIEKYAKQTEKGTDILSLIISGRVEFFIGLMAAVDKPLIGQGSQALDLKGYRGYYIGKYGTAEEVERHLRLERANSGFYATIPAHSHLICYWMWHGVTALIFWIYVLYLAVITLRKRLHYIPEWYGYFVISLPVFFWDYFFSPLGLRVNESALYCAMLYLIKIDNDRKRGYVTYEI
jgi:hypothetical protein